MNERIKELMLEAGYAAPELAGRANKLAELIVRECATVGRACQIWGEEKIDEYIKKHFGVEDSKGWVCPKCGIDRAKEACPNGYHAALTGQCPMIGVAQ